jgi:RNA polymerase sigma-70 factor (ECF subfamily)
LLKNENILLKAVSAGDESAYAEVYRYYYPKVKCFFLQLISNEDDVKDLAQNVFIKIWLMRGILSEIRSFGAYLYKMCRNAAIDYCKHRNINIPLDDQEYVEVSSTLDEGYFAKEIEAQVARAIDKMPKKRRKVYIMSRVEGLSNDQIASELNISKRTVENHITTVLKELRKITSCLSIFM